MADRRAFAKSITESDAFVSMSAEAQCLYFHINMYADDDGFVNNALSICRSLGFGKPVLDELFHKRFLLDMGDGITVVKGWFVNNIIRKDRWKPTIYQEQLSRLRIRESDGSYTLVNHSATKSQPKRNQNATNPQPNITKHNITKHNEEDIRIREIAERTLEMGYPSSVVDEALNIYDKGLYPKTADFFQKIINALTDAEIFNKDGYIWQMAQNEVKA